MKILVAIEGSEFSRSALESAIAYFGNSKDNELILVTAVDPIIPPIEPFAVSAEYIQRMDDTAREAGHALLDKTLETVRTEHPNLAATITTRFLTGAPAQMIVEEAESCDADLIVMGSHGYGFWHRTMLGSVSNSVMHHAPCSVMIVRTQASASAASK